MAEMANRVRLRASASARARGNDHVELIRD